MKPAFEKIVSNLKDEWRGKCPVRRFGMGVCLCLVALAFSPVRAAELPPLVPSAFADTEASTNITFPTRTSRARLFMLLIELDATAENNLDVTFGVDENANGALERDERRFSVGWDCGCWYWFDRTTGLTSFAAAAPGRRTLDWRLGLDPELRPNRGGLSATDGGVAVFAPEPSSGMFDPDWNLVRVSARGQDATTEAVSVGVCHVGLSVRVR